MGSPGPFRDVTVGRLLTQLAEWLPGHDALVYPHRNLRWTFLDLETEARLIARGLIASGVERGDRVAVWATNVPEWVVLQFALAKIGAILVTVNTSLRAREIEYLLRQSETSTLFTIAGFRDVDYVAELREAMPAGVKRVFFIGDHCPDGLTPYAALREAAASVPDDTLDDRAGAIRVDDVINMQYTSGTTGFPKGVMLSSRNIVNNGYWIGEGLGYTPDDRLCLCVPLFHCFGCVLGVLAAYTHGAALYPVEAFDPRRVLETVDRGRCTALYGVPTMFLAELDHPEFARFDTSTLRTGIMAGALCPEPLMRRVIEQMKMRELTIVYGLTETSPGLTQTPRDADLAERTQTVGRVLPEVDVRIVNPGTGEPCPTGEDGELWAKGYVVMKGYYKMPEATAAAITADGWLRSGDGGHIDAEGYVYVTDRIKDMIISGGENIYPAEIESVIAAHPDVVEAALIGVPDERWGEVGRAFVVVRAAASLDEAALQAFLRMRLAKYKLPKTIRFIDALPRTGPGKVDKRALARLD
jgi:fatty-acyl-CoA synthase